MEKSSNLIDYINEQYDLIMQKTDDMQKSSVSELHMHKILYIIYGMFYKNFKRELFIPKFEAWKYGPVEIHYREILRKNQVNDYDKYFAYELKNDEEEKFLNNLTQKLLKISPWFLVDFLHTTSSWSEHFDENSVKNNEEIPNIEIQKEFKNINL